MPVADETALTLTEPAVHYLVRTSLVMDLVWALVLHDGEPDPDNYPVRAGRFAAAPGLEERIAAFWDDGEVCCGYVEDYCLAMDEVLKLNKA